MNVHDNKTLGWSASAPGDPVFEVMRGPSRWRLWGGIAHSSTIDDVRPGGRAHRVEVRPATSQVSGVYRTTRRTSGWCYLGLEAGRARAGTGTR